MPIGFRRLGVLAAVLASALALASCAQSIPGSGGMAAAGRPPSGTTSASPTRSAPTPASPPVTTSPPVATSTPAASATPSATAAPSTSASTGRAWTPVTDATTGYSFQLPQQPQPTSSSTGSYGIELETRQYSASDITMQLLVSITSEASGRAIGFDPPTDAPDKLSKPLRDKGYDVEIGDRVDGTTLGYPSVTCTLRFVDGQYVNLVHALFVSTPTAMVSLATMGSMRDSLEPLLVTLLQDDQQRLVDSLVLT